MKYICVSYIDALERHSKFVSPSGDGFVDVYEQRNDAKTGAEEIVLTGKKSLFDEIQAYRDSTEIQNIITRFLNGETDILNQASGVYADVSNAPTSYADYFAKVKEAEKIFNALPDEVKDKFDYDAEKFFLEFGTDSFVSKVSELDNKEEIIKESEVIDNAE